MPKFTPGKWKLDAKTVRMSCRVFRTVRAGDIDSASIAVIPSNHGISEHEALANGRLIAAAPEMYRLLKEELIPTSDYGGILSFSRAAKVRELLARIDGDETKS